MDIKLVQPHLDSDDADRNLSKRVMPSIAIGSIVHGSIGITSIRPQKVKLFFLQSLMLAFYF